jgi:hypothetical protein
MHPLAITPETPPADAENPAMTLHAAAQARARAPLARLGPSDLLRRQARFAPSFREAPWR